MDIHKITGTIEQQLLIEEESKAKGVIKFKEQIHKATEQGRFTETPYGAILIKLGFEPFRDKIKEYLESDIGAGHHTKQRNLLRLISDDPDVIAYEVLTSVINYSIRPQASLALLSSAIMRRLFDNYMYGKLKDDNPKLHTYLGYAFRRATKRRKKELIEKNIASLYDEFDLGSSTLKMQVGVLLINLLELSGANIITINLIVKQRKPRRTERQLEFTDEAKAIMSSIDGQALALRCVERAPSVVPPLDWTAINKGGYRSFKDKLVSYGKSRTLKEFQRDQDYSNVFPIINKLQQTPWRVNSRMLDIIDTVFTNNLPVGGLPSSTATTWKDHMTMPSGDDYDKDKWAAANKKRQELQIELDAVFNKRLLLMFAIGTAKNMLKYKQFYYSYSLDYRGRVYPTSTHLNVLSPKHVKALLEFGEGQYLTVDGLRWLKIHIANCNGLDKEPYDERVQWVDDNYDSVVKVGEDALAYTNLWDGADSPFEYVAACQAFVDHLNGEKVYIPIQLDATCSGIQMYSGLTLDKVGARSVNVIGSARNDIYQQVANGVENKLQKCEYDSIVSYSDSEGKLHSVLTDATANSLRGNITRSLVKRPTMTVPYSVTMRGMQNQIDDELISLEEKGKAFWVGEKWVANRIITSLTSASIYSILDGAKKGQEYLVELSRTLPQPAVWYTPIYNFPVHQDTIKGDKFQVKTLYGEVTIRLEGEEHDKRKQANQIAPNFIHSIDSTILFGTIDETDGLIGTIHDCFLVPPNSGYEVQEAYRKAFVEVMETDPLRSIQQRLDPLEAVEFPSYGDLDLNDVYDAQYIIS